MLNGLDYGVYYYDYEYDYYVASEGEESCFNYCINIHKEQGIVGCMWDPEYPDCVAIKDGVIDGVSGEVGACWKFEPGKTYTNHNILSVNIEYIFQ